MKKFKINNVEFSVADRPEQGTVELFVFVPNDTDLSRVLKLRLNQYSVQDKYGAVLKKFLVRNIKKDIKKYFSKIKSERTEIQVMIEGITLKDLE